MPTPIEQREYQEPLWQEFSWVINNQRLTGVFHELEGLKKIRLALAIPADAENVMIDIRQRKRRERDDTGNLKFERDEECYVISYWSPGLKIGQLVTIPRELVRRQGGSLIFIHVEQVSVYSFGPSDKPTFTNLA